jgi:hypothetical protein
MHKSLLKHKMLICLVHYIVIIIIAIIVIVALVKFVFQLFLIGPAGIEALDIDIEIFNRLIFSLEPSHQEATI